MLWHLAHSLREHDHVEVKYTPNPAVHALSWEWMLEKAGKTAMSRSMLRKWLDAFVALEPARVGVLSLKTNRRPDSEIEACLACGRIDLANVPEPRRSEVIAELGRGTAYRTTTASTASEVRSFYLWRVRTLHRKGSFDRFEETLTFGAALV